MKAGPAYVAAVFRSALASSQDGRLAPLLGIGTLDHGGPEGTTEAVRIAERIPA